MVNMVLEKTHESPLGCTEIKLISPKGNQDAHWRTDAEAEAPIFWSPDVQGQLIRKDPDDEKE